MVIQQELQQSKETTVFQIIQLLRLDKMSGRLLTVIPGLWAVFLAGEGKPPLSIVSLIVAIGFLSNIAGCVVNDLWDRNIDSHVSRTCDRPLASQALSVQVAAVVGLALLGCVITLAFYLKPISFWLFATLIPIIIVYPLAKRVFPLPGLVLAITFGFAVLISWSAVTGDLEFSTWLLASATMLWTIGFETIYAMSDCEGDLEIGIRSSALFFGKYAPIAIGILFTGTTALLSWLGLYLQLQVSFWICLLIAFLGWTRQFVRLQRNPKLHFSAYIQMFRQNVWIGIMLLFGMILGSITF